MSGWLVLMLTITIAGREGLREVNVLEAMELRSVFGFCMLAPIVLFNGGFATMKTTRLATHTLRNLVHYVAQGGWFVALTLIPIGQLVAIEFTLPIWTAILAVTLLGERMTPWKVAAVALGVVGVLVIVRPATNAFNPGQLIALAAAVGLGVSVALVKLLTRTETSLAIIFWMTVIQSAVGLVPALMVWSWPSAHGLGWIFLIAFSGTFSHFCMARAMLYADATIVVPMDFLRVPLTATAGWLLYSERLDAFTILGAALILLGNLLNLKPAGRVPAPAGT
jgi:drug/metabolite transporter (DMT)-like permease